MGARFQDHGGGAFPRVSQRRSGRRAPPRQPGLPLFRSGDAVRWATPDIVRTGIVERVLPDETADVREVGSGRLYRVPIARLCR